MGEIAKCGNKWIRILYKPCMPLGPNNTLITGSKEHIEFSRRLAAEGIVLLKNNEKLLPLNRHNKIAVFGKGQYDYVKGGGGSGDTFVAYTRNIYEGLKIKEQEQKIVLFDGLYNYYKEEVEKQYREGIKNGYTTEPDVPEDLLKEAVAFTDTAIISINRFSSEGYDRKGEEHDGDFYLSIEEEKMVKTVTENFKKVIVVINAGAQTDTGWYYKNDRIQSVLYAWQGGMEGGLAVADVLVGDVNPSAKLVDTFAEKFSDYPSSDTFFESDDYVKYYEDIYVGYRYFETIKGADKKVIYPFGFGLSYTEFEITNVIAKKVGNKFKFFADVQNVGEYAGREVIQVYFSAPQGKLGKPKYQLCAFKKTNLIQPGDKVTVMAECDIYGLSSYDDLGKVFESAYVLEKGTYEFFIGNSIRNTTKTKYAYEVKKDVLVEQLSRRCPPKDLEKRLLSNGKFEKMPSFKNTTKPLKYKKNKEAPAEEREYLIDVFQGKTTLDKFISQLSNEELAKLTFGTHVYGSSDRGMSQTSFMGNLEKFGIPKVETADGPAGLHTQPYTKIHTTAFPVATAIACTWDLDLMEEMGRTGAMEVKEQNVGIWLTPALNIHRNPLCGRNFEYFSEDPLIAGKMAAAQVKGIQSVGIACSAKHFFANSKETNRFFSDSIISERAIREIYLKGFEICVKESDPWTIMSSYNLINGIPASENIDSLSYILRGEWGFKGLVTTDWNNGANAIKEKIAGNDIRMPGDWQRKGSPKLAKMIEMLNNGKLNREVVEECVKNLLKLFFKID